MVCPNCNSKPSIIKKEIEKKDVPEKPSGWDETDEYIERRYKEKQKQKRGEPLPNFEKIEGSRFFIKYTCRKCGYKFKYNTLKHWPRVCPSCAKEIGVVDPTLL